MVYLPYADDTHIRVDATNGNGEHDVDICVRENDEGDQITQGEDPDEETRLDGTANQSVENCIRPLEATSPTREDDDQSNCRL